ncbi:hypothetical protein D6833_06555 [Candidatus Parcubacteria bacterium]|nr:MAG: hypothetical protein D6833_06555 [Candidatus Parcubacteria bacterium]
MNTDKHFDVNRCAVSGQVVRIWDWGEDVLFRVAFVPEGAPSPRQVTMRVPLGMVNGELVDLAPGDFVRVSGFLESIEFQESLQDYLRFARVSDFKETGDGWNDVTFRRSHTRISVLDVEKIGKGDVSPASVMLQGVVTRSWPLKQRTAVRLAVYDEYTTIITPANGKPERRRPHYATVLMPPGRNARRGERIRAAGTLSVRLYREPIERALLRNGYAELLQKADRDYLEGISALRSSVSVNAKAVSIFARLPRAGLVVNLPE